MGQIPEGRKPLTPKHSSWEAEAKALRAENERLIEERFVAIERAAALEAIVLDYRLVLHSAKAGRDLYCGMYVAKKYHFTRDQIGAALTKISAVLGENTTALSELRDQARPAKADAPEQDMPDGCWDGAEMRPAEDKQ
jgi:hypothetical protein